MDPTAQVAYVRWGGDDPERSSHTFRDEAAEAGVWVGDEVGDFVFVLESTRGITITDNGDVTNPLDWTYDVPPDCLR